MCYFVRPSGFMQLYERNCVVIYFNIYVGMNVAVELAPVLSSPESGVSSNPGSKRPAVGGSTVSKRLKMLDS